MAVYISILISQFTPPFLPALHPHIHSMRLSLDSCPANRFNSAFFLDSVSKCVNIQYFFFFLTSLCMTDCGSIHITTNDPVLFLLMAEEYSMRVCVCVCVCECIYIYMPHLFYQFLCSWFVYWLMFFAFIFWNIAIIFEWLLSLQLRTQ